MWKGESGGEIGNSKHTHTHRHTHRRKKIALGPFHLEKLTSLFCLAKHNFNIQNKKWIGYQGYGVLYAPLGKVDSFVVSMIKVAGCYCMLTSHKSEKISIHILVFSSRLTAVWYQRIHGLYVFAWKIVCVFISRASVKQRSIIYTSSSSWMRTHVPRTTFYPLVYKRN